MIRKFPTMDASRFMITARRRARGYVIRVERVIEERVSTRYFASVNYRMGEGWIAQSLDSKVRSSPFDSIEEAVNALMSHQEFVAVHEP